MVDDACNARHAEQLAPAGNQLAVLVVPAGEEVVIARQTATLISR